MFDITSEIDTDAEKARKYLEALHRPNGPICLHCGNSNETTITKLANNSARPGVY